MTEQRQIDISGAQTPNVRERSRGPRANKAMKEAAEAMYGGNKAKNAAATIERQGKKTLDYEMAQASDGKPWSFRHTFEPVGGKSGERVTVEAVYEQPDKESMDVRKLFEEVDKETFFKIVTASRGAVEKHAGKNIANVCATTKKGEFGAKVKAQK